MNYIVLDTETANSLEDALTYDIGWAVINDDGEVLLTRSYVCCDIFMEERELMTTAYYAEKIPSYFADIANGIREIKWFKDIKAILRKDCKDFGIEAIMAHNASFDYRALQTSQRYITKSKYRYFFPYGIEIWDTLKMARQVFAHDEDYLNFCRENGFMTNHKKPQARLTAEVLHRYLSKDINFSEAHKALDDVMIEKDIFIECIKRNPNIVKKLWND